LLRRAANRLGYDVVRRVDEREDPALEVELAGSSPSAPPVSVLDFPADIDAETIETFRAVRDYTMTSLERVAALCEAVRYVTRHAVAGDLVECGVWRGGSTLAAARTLLACGDTDRTLWLYDTFTGMPPPTAADKRGTDGASATELLASHDRDSDLWAVSGLDEVRRVMSLCAYPKDRIRYIEGRVEETIPVTVPDQIAVLRLDTDWYESTHHELVHLVPRITPGGVLIVDDYGFWQGARQAVDEYLEVTKIRLLLNRIDDTGRIAILPG
jgi:O-methyltransferase